MLELSLLNEKYEISNGCLTHRLDYDCNMKGKPVGYLSKRHNGVRRMAEVGGKKYKVSVLTWMIANQAEVPDGHVVHHSDCNESNDHPGNLVVWPKSFHDSWHKARRRKPACLDIYHKALDMQWRSNLEAWPEI